MNGLFKNNQNNIKKIIKKWHLLSDNDKLKKKRSQLFVKY